MAPASNARSTTLLTVQRCVVQSTSTTASTQYLQAGKSELSISGSLSAFLSLCLVAVHRQGQIKPVKPTHARIDLRQHCEHHKQFGGCSHGSNMECGTGTGTAHSRPSSSQWMQTGRRAARKAPARFLPFVNAASSANKQKSTLASDVSRRQTLQHLMLAAAALSLDATSHLVHPHRAEAALVQFPTADLRNSYYLVSLIRTVVVKQVVSFASTH